MPISSLQFVLIYLLERVHDHISVWKVASVPSGLVQEGLKHSEVSLLLVLHAFILRAGLKKGHPFNRLGL